MAIVTLSGQIGTNAREIGRVTADRLGIDYVDQEILVEAARDLGVPMESIVTHDERTEGLLATRWVDHGPLLRALVQSIADELYRRVSVALSPALPRGA